MDATASAESPLVGRAAELDRLVTELAHAGSVAYVLAGPAGVGKSRLAAEAAAAASGLGFTVVHVAGTQASSSIPFGPFARFLPLDVSPQDLLGLLRILSAAIVEQAGEDGRLVLVVDDAHLLDDGSAALLDELVHARSCSVIVTMRTPAPAANPLTALWKDGLVQRLDLGPLDEREVSDLATSLIGGPVAGATLHRLNETSGGNPLWLRELIIGATRSGALVDSGGMWTLRDALTAPDRLAELIAARLDELSPETMAVIELLAAGENLDLAVLEQHTAQLALEDAERQGLIEITQDRRRTVAHLSHPIYGEVLRQRLPRSRLRRLWALLAESLAATGARRREDLLRLVTWQLDAGLAGQPDLLSAAAQLAGRMSDKELAARLAKAAFDIDGGVEAGLALGVAEFSLGRHAEAERVLALLVDTCTTDEELSRVAGARAYNLNILMGLHDVAALVIEQALAVVSEPTARLRLFGRLASNRLFDGHVMGAREAASALLDSDHPGLVGQGCYTASIAAALLGHGDEAVALAARGMAAFRQSTDTHQLPETQLIGDVLGNAARGQLGQALTSAESGYQACLLAGDKEGQATFSLLQGWALTDQGRLPQASLAFLEGASINRQIHDTGALRWCLGGLALSEGMAGRLDGASAAVNELDELPPGWMGLFEAELIERGRAWASVVAGELTHARERLEQAASRTATTHQPVAEAHMLHDLARLGQPGAVKDRLRDLAEQVDGDLIDQLAHHAAALAEASAADLTACADRFEASGALLLAAEASATAARVYRVDGLARAASAQSSRAAQFLAACGDVSTPALAGGTSRDRLTARELEVASLAATGNTSREIASTLFLSVRTVDNHLQNAYTKLGVANRTELGAALSRS